MNVIVGVPIVLTMHGKQQLCFGRLFGISGSMRSSFVYRLVWWSVFFALNALWCAKAHGEASGAAVVSLQFFGVHFRSGRFKGPSSSSYCEESRAECLVPLFDIHNRLE